jgi:hypothetical protein
MSASFSLVFSLRFFRTPSDGGRRTHFFVSFESVKGNITVAKPYYVTVVILVHLILIYKINLICGRFGPFCVWNFFQKSIQCRAEVRNALVNGNDCFT